MKSGYEQSDTLDLICLGLVATSCATHEHYDMKEMGFFKATVSTDVYKRNINQSRLPSDVNGSNNNHLNVATQ